MQEFKNRSQNPGVRRRTAAATARLFKMRLVPSFHLLGVAGQGSSWTVAATDHPPRPFWLLAPILELLELLLMPFDQPLQVIISRPFMLLGVSPEELEIFDQIGFFDRAAFPVVGHATVR